MSLQHQGNTQEKSVKNPQAPLGGAIIGPDGKEIIITEEMVQQACKTLEESRKDPAKKD
ncbi:PA1571 family protein [Pseudomonas sp. 2(2015)]|uniref:PA1571 family protein n=1 Tax=Pseudomonas sp. 2(2015) TaxID=1619950 RepID=UPI000AF21FF7|nr:PA1571 family protein [Pseudomonas sp. 2(2015)]